MHVLEPTYVGKISLMPNFPLREFEFTLILTSDPSEAEADRLYSKLNDGTISTTRGVPRIHFQRESPSLEDAIRSAVRDVRSGGFEVERVEMLPEVLPK